MKAISKLDNQCSGTIDGTVYIEGNFLGKNNAEMFGDGNVEVMGSITLQNGSSLFGSSSNCSPGPCEYGSGQGLPVTLTECKATFIDQDVVRINWKTEAEINNDYFIIECSHDGKSFQQINKQFGAGNSNKTLDYYFIDYIDKPVEYLYYRLTQVDFDGKSETFPVIVAKKQSI